MKFYTATPCGTLGFKIELEEEPTKDEGVFRYTGIITWFDQDHRDTQKELRRIKRIRMDLLFTYQEHKLGFTQYTLDGHIPTVDRIRQDVQNTIRDYSGVELIHGAEAAAVLRRYHDKHSTEYRWMQYCRKMEKFRFEINNWAEFVIKQWLKQMDKRGVSAKHPDRLIVKQGIML